MPLTVEDRFNPSSTVRKTRLLSLSLEFPQCLSGNRTNVASSEFVLKPLKLSPCLFPAVGANVPGLAGTLLLLALGSAPKPTGCRTIPRFHGAPRSPDIRLATYLMLHGVVEFAPLEEIRAAARGSARPESVHRLRSCSNHSDAPSSSCRQCSGRSSVARLERRCRGIPQSPSLPGGKPLGQYPERPDLV